MRFRKVRIAWSIFWGLTAVLLIVMWVRSYWQGYSVAGYTQYGSNIRAMLKCDLEAGRIKYTAVPGFQAAFTATRWQRSSYPRHVLGGDDSYGFMGFYHDEFEWCVPVWFSAALSATVAALPWIHLSRRFSLRTLLLSTAVVAIMLRLAVYAVRK